jgi:hypothetical protein
MKVGEEKTYKLAGHPCGGEKEGAESVLEVSVSYSLGGANFWQGTQEKRGYWLHVTPVGLRREEAGYTVKSFTIGAGPRGVKAFLMEVKRRTAKGDAQAVKLAQAKERELLEHVLAKNGMALAPGVELPQASAEPAPALPSGVVAGAPKPAPLSAGQVWLTKENLLALPPLGGQEGEEDPTAHVKFFDPSGSWTWYATEYDPAYQRFFGLVVGAETELGYFTLAELKEIRGAVGLGIERDRHFKPCRLSEIAPGLYPAKAGGAGHAS